MNDSERDAQGQQNRPVDDGGAADRDHSPTRNAGVRGGHVGVHGGHADPGTTHGQAMPVEDGHVVDPLAASGHDGHDAHAGHEHGGITLVGLMHGLAGTSAVVALVPVTMLQSLSVGLGYLVMFGVGVTAAMTLFAMAAAYAMRHAAARSLVWGRHAARVVGTAGVVVGAWWVLRAAGVVG